MDDDDDSDEKALMERLKKLSVPASDEEDEGKGTEGKGSCVRPWSAGASPHTLQSLGLASGGARCFLDPSLPLSFQCLPRCPEDGRRPR